MQKVVLDQATRSKLRNLTELTEFRDEDGHVLGHFLPLDRPTGLLDAVRTCPHTDEEIEELAKQTGGRLAEIWKSLGRTA